MSKPVTFAICGCGDRGLDSYAPYQELRPQEMKITAGADIRPERLALLQKRYGVPPEMCFSSDEALLAQPRLADVMLVSTLDRRHVANALAATDEQEQTRLYKRAEEILNERAASLWIQDLCDLAVVSPKLDGFTFYPTYVIDMSTVYYK